MFLRLVAPETSLPRDNDHISLALTEETVGVIQYDASRLSMSVTFAASIDYKNTVVSSRVSPAEVEFLIFLPSALITHDNIYPEYSAQARVNT